MNPHRFAIFLPTSVHDRRSAACSHVWLIFCSHTVNWALQIVSGNPVIGFFLSVHVMYFSMGSWLPRDFTILYICLEASVWALMVAGALLAKAGLWWLWCRRAHLSDSTKHLCCSALTVRYSQERQCGCASPQNTAPRAAEQVRGVCMWTALGKQCCFAVQSSTDQQLLIEGLKQLLVQQNALRTNCKGTARPSD